MDRRFGLKTTIICHDHTNQRVARVHSSGPTDQGSSTISLTSVLPFWGLAWKCWSHLSSTKSCVASDLHRSCWRWSVRYRSLAGYKWRLTLAGPWPTAECLRGRLQKTESPSQRQWCPPTQRRCTSTSSYQGLGHEESRVSPQSWAGRWARSCLGNTRNFRSLWWLRCHSCRHCHHSLDVWWSLL